MSLDVIEYEVESQEEQENVHLRLTTDMIVEQVLCKDAVPEENGDEEEDVIWISSGNIPTKLQSLQ